MIKFLKYMCVLHLLKMSKKGDLSICEDKPPMKIISLN